MGRKSTKENKNIYQTSRETAELTRDAAAAKLEFISSDRIEKIENEKSYPHPDEILAMADCYKNPSLCNYYCSHECPIGQEYVPAVVAKDLSVITLEMLSTLNTLTREKDRLFDIAADGDWLDVPMRTVDNVTFVNDTDTSGVAVESIAITGGKSRITFDTAGAVTNVQCRVTGH